ncbi:MAG: hypothetical protein V4592_18455 [Bacteroidota bacterium]
MKKQPRVIRLFLLLPVLLTMVSISYAQQGTDSAGIKKLLDKVEAHQKALTSEKLYLHFDKPYYAVGDTIWVKTYLLNTATRNASAFSNKVYVDLLNDSSKLIQTLVIPMASGLGQGDFKLSESLHEGAYTIRAYTNWMQNFGADCFFHQQFYIGKPEKNSWLVSEQHQANLAADGKQVKMALKLKDTQGRPIVGEAITMRVLDGKRSILKSDVQTAVDGSIHTDLLIPAKTDGRKLSLLLTSKQDKNKTIKFPLYAQVAGDIDLQLMPEGGSLVAGLYNKIGFKAIGEDGLGADVEGRIVNSKNEDIVAFKSLHNGMGCFTMVPNAGDTYTAKLKLPGGQEKNYNLPIVKTSGLVLRVDAVSNPDTVRLYITGMADRTAANASYYLLAQGKDISYFGVDFKLTGGYFNTRIPKKMFPTGIINFTVLDQDARPVNARNIFINGHDQLNIAMLSDKPVYAANDSIGLNFMVTDKANFPIQANFSVSVTDDSQVKNDLRDQHINSYILLSAELKGHIENPNWYFNAAQPLAAQALDNLMLTQGWIGFTINKALEKTSPQPVYLAEADNSIEGKLTNFFNKPAANRQVTLMSHWHDILIMDTISNQEGRFVFKNLPFTDSASYTIKIHNAKGKEAAVGITVNEFKPAAMPAPDSIRLMPWYVNTDTTLLRYLDNNQKRIAEKPGPVDASGRLLKEVKIKGAKKARLQGQGGEDIYFADLDIDDNVTTKQGNISLLTYLMGKVQGFHEGHNKYGELLFMKAAFVANVQIDSVWVSRYWTRDTKIMDFYKLMLDNIPAAAVKNLVIYHKPTPNGKDWMSFVIIKTRSGNGPVLKETPGVYVYRPLPLYIPREFYRPRYAVKNQSAKADLRSTIHWEPNLVSDEHGNAKLSFYAADKPGTYTVTIEGTDMQGHFGADTRKIIIAPGTSAK